MWQRLLTWHTKTNEVQSTEEKYRWRQQYMYCKYDAKSQRTTEIQLWNDLKWDLNLEPLGYKTKLVPHHCTTLDKHCNSRGNKKRSIWICWYYNFPPNRSRCCHRLPARGSRTIRQFKQQELHTFYTWLQIKSKKVLLDNSRVTQLCSLKSCVCYQKDSWYDDILITIQHPVRPGKQDAV